ncbi:MAG: MarR family transcriptional regulator [Candidatus Nitrosoglobus sp.]
MTQKVLSQIDINTGEIMEDGFVAYIAPKRRNGFNGRWFAMAQDALDVLAQLKRVEDFRVLMALLKRLDYENLITANQAEISRELEIDRGNVNKAIKRLIQAGAVLEGPKVGTSRTYRLNPNFGWKGSAKGHREALEKRMRDTGIKVIQGKKK